MLHHTQLFSFTSGLSTAVLSLGTSSSYPLLWKLSISCPVLPSLGHLYEHLGLLLHWEYSHLLSPTSEGVQERWGEPLSSWYGGGCSSSSGGVLLILWMQFAENKWKYFAYVLIIHCSNSSVENVNLNAWTENLKIYVCLFFFKFYVSNQMKNTTEKKFVKNGNEWSLRWKKFR